MKRSKKEPLHPKSVSKTRKDLEKEAIDVIKCLPDKKIIEIMEALK